MAADSQRLRKPHDRNLTVSSDGNSGDQSSLTPYRLRVGHALRIVGVDEAAVIRWVW